MKFILPALVAFISVSSAARAADLTFLDCIASNGVLIKGQGVAGEPIKVETHWGFIARDFLASLSDASTADTTYVNLDTSNGTEYVIALDAIPARMRVTQKASGTILQPSSLRGVQPAVVAYVRCDLRIR